MTALYCLVAVLTCPAHTSRLVGPDACASSLIRPFPRVPPFGVRDSGGLVVGRVGGFAWGLWAFPWGAFLCFLLCCSFFLFLLSLFSVPPGCLAPFVFSSRFLLPFPAAVSPGCVPCCGCLLACLGFRLAALPSRPRFALLFFLLQMLG